MWLDRGCRDTRLQPAGVAIESPLRGPENDATCLIPMSSSITDWQRIGVSDSERTREGCTQVFKCEGCTQVLKCLSVMAAHTGSQSATAYQSRHAPALSCRPTCALPPDVCLFQWRASHDPRCTR